MQQQQASKVTVDDPAWWDNLYRTKRTPWDIGKPAPPLETYLKSPYAVAPGKIAIPGSGNGHDCMLFIKHGFEVTGIDFAPTPIATTHAKMEQAGVSGKKGFLLQRDVFDIHEYDGYYDYILEDCFFSAIDPSRRRTYVMTVYDLLKPGGKVISLWWLINNKQGPPFAVDKSEIYELFDSKFTIDMAFAPTDSIKERKGAEFITVMTKR
jgi:SAM-dependent methyltransferase